MKNLYPKSKGKIYPSPSSAATAAAAASSSSSSPYSTANVLNLLPAAILALISVLGFEDREVLAYLILRSMKTPSLMLEEKKKCKKPPNTPHKPLLDCPCFDCYTSFWIRWDSSSNRELIHQAIEVFEEHLAKRESPKKGRKKDRRLTHKEKGPLQKLRIPELDAETDKPTVNIITDREAPTTTTTITTPGKKDDDEVLGEVTRSPLEPAEPVEEKVSTVPPQQPASNNRGLVGKVWPDVMGMFNSRLWGIWNPNV
ncbi:uncharacterized protein [Aristolochia californica]|uniref:uncharacterized protein n=1 Tax=Aristolochia californica TaxID=171875 RepID=UPI0035E263DD